MTKAELPSLGENVNLAGTWLIAEAPGQFTVKLVEPKPGAVAPRGTLMVRRVVVTVQLATTRARTSMVVDVVSASADAVLNNNAAAAKQSPRARLRPGPGEAHRASERPRGM